jgi:hypothetical protein
MLKANPVLTLMNYDVNWRFDKVSFELNHNCCDYF